MFVGRSSAEECVIEESEKDCCRGGRAGGSVGCAWRGRSSGGGEVDRLADGDKLGVGGGAPGTLLAAPLLERLSCSFLF